MTSGLTKDKPFGGARLDSYAQRLYICPTDNVLVGASAICKYLGISSINSLWRWTELYAFPAIKRPDGLWMSTMTAIDQWIFLAAEVVNDNLERSRGLNTTAKIAAERLQRQLDDPELFAQKRAATARRAARGVGLLPGRKEPRTPYLTSGIERALRAMHNNAVDAMKVENCPKCGGTHFGSYECPMPDSHPEECKCDLCNADAQHPNPAAPGLRPEDVSAICQLCYGQGHVYGGERGETMELCECQNG